MRWLYFPLLLVLIVIYGVVHGVTLVATRADKWLDRKWRMTWYLFETGGGL